MQEIIKKEFTEGTPGHVVQARYFYFDADCGRNVKLHILCGGYEKCAPDFALNRKNLAFYTVKFTLGGKGLFCHNNKTYPLNFGSLTAFGPRIPHQFKTDPTDPMEHIFIVFMGQQAERLFNAGALGENYSIHVPNPQFTATLLEQILKTGVEKPPFAQEICRGYLASLLLEQARIRDDSSSGGSLESFLKCKGYLDSHFTNISSVAQLAEQCCLDIRYIARLFRRYEQMRPYDYLMRLKMDKAANLLLTTNFSIKQIARMTGLEDPYHFSRLFKKIFKIAPSEYRRSFIEPHR